MSNTPRAGQLWRQRTSKDIRTRYMRIAEVDSRYVHGYAWWEETADSGRSTRIELDTVVRKWDFVPEADTWVPGGAA